MEEPKPEEQKAEYHVEQDTKPCEKCGHGATYMVVGPDDIGGSVSYTSSDDAQEMADDLNDAFHKGERNGR